MQKMCTNVFCAKYVLIILYSDQQMHNYLTKYHTPTCFDTLCHPQGAYNQYLAKLYKYFKCSCW